MNIDVQPPARPFWPWSLVWAALFAVAHTQAPEYYSNQHQYYLHGLATAGVGHLDEDWLANTKDPTPVFSAGVAILYKLLGPFGLHAAYFVLLGIYFESMRRLVEAIPGFPDRRPARVLFLTLFLAVHAAIVRVGSVWLTEVDYPWFLQAGLAAQYLLGPGLQPSAFGVLLISSLAAYVNGRPILAAALAAGATVVHSTYLLPAGLLTLGYFVGLVREQRPRVAVTAGGVALAIALPVVIYNAVVFGPRSSKQFESAQALLAEVRIPHHAIVERWHDALAIGQIGVMIVGLALVWRTRLFVPLAVPAVVSALLTGVQVITGDDTLALLFPWRFSVVLMPVAVAVILAKFAQAIARLGESFTSLGILLLVLAGPGVLAVRHPWLSVTGALLLTFGGVWVTATGRGYQVNEAERPLLDHVREHKKSGDVYLLPVKFPTLKKEVPASQSKTFVPPVRPGAVGIPVDLQRFRLYTGAPIFVDFKAVPYAAAEVLEWHSRMTDVEKWYGQRHWDATDVVGQVAAAGVTHVVTTADRDVTSTRLELDYADANYRLYRVKYE